MRHRQNNSNRLPFAIAIHALLQARIAKEPDSGGILLQYKRTYQRARPISRSEIVPPTSNFDIRSWIFGKTLVIRSACREFTRQGRRGDTAFSLHNDAKAASDG